MNRLAAPEKRYPKRGIKLGIPILKMMATYAHIKLKTSLPNEGHVKLFDTTSLINLLLSAALKTPFRSHSLFISR